ncbi:MAG: RIP metalloprotease RseP [Elusimicrobia bacterium]|nr:RIP metalloprotease RseP [Elusimicrobiota bacterium]
MTIVLGVIAVMVMFGFVVVIHETGHFFIAKKMKVRVMNFSLGFGPELFGWTGKKFSFGSKSQDKGMEDETRYSVRPIPFGGFVKMAGEEISESTGASDEFFSKKWYERIGIVAAGPAMNYISAFLIFMFVIIIWGVQYQRPVVKFVEKDMPAFSSGLEAGDEIVAINGETIEDAHRVSEMVKSSENNELLFSIKRDDSILDIRITPEYDKKVKTARIGIVYDMASEPITVKVGPVKAVKEAFNQVVFWTVMPLKYLYMKLMLFEAPAEVSGPVGIMRAAYFMAKLGPKAFLTFIAIVSVALGMLNLLPIPIVDGGHIMFYLFEGISGRPLNTKVIQFANSVGFALLITLMVYATYQDIKREKNGFWKKIETVKPADGVK